MVFLSKLHCLRTNDSALLMRSWYKTTSFKNCVAPTVRTQAINEGLEEVPAHPPVEQVSWVENAHARSKLRTNPGRTSRKTYGTVSSAWSLMCCKTVVAACTRSQKASDLEEGESAKLSSVDMFDRLSFAELLETRMSIDLYGRLMKSLESGKSI